MKIWFLAASVVAVTGLIGAFDQGPTIPVALDASVSSHVGAYNGPAARPKPSPTPSSTPSSTPSPTASPTASSNSTAVPDPTTTPTFSSNFTGTSLNTSIWATCYPWFTNPSAGCQNFGNGQEQEWYLPSQDQVSGGVLNLVAQHETTQGENSSGAAETYDCRSGMVTTYPSFNFEYGIVQVVADIPQTYGLWGGVWLLPTSQTWPPEIDMAETWGPPDTESAATFHPVDYDVVQASEDVALPSGWNTFTLDWTPTSLTWWLNGTEVLTTTSDIPNQQMYLLLNLADYALTSTQGCSGTMEIQSVKIWEQS